MKKIFENRVIKIAGISIFSLTTLSLLVSLLFRIFGSSPADGLLDKKNQNETVAESIQVEILNGCGEDGIASKARKFMRMRGFDVVEIGNHTNILEKSVVIDRLGDARSALKSAYAMGIKDSLVYSNPDSSLYIRNTIIIGMDFQSLKFEDQFPMLNLIE